MARRLKATTWIEKHNGLELDVHELSERLASQVREGEPLQEAAAAVREALSRLDNELEALGWNA